MRDIETRLGKRWLTHESDDARWETERYDFNISKNKSVYTIETTDADHGKCMRVLNSVPSKITKHKIPVYKGL